MLRQNPDGGYDPLAAVVVTIRPPPKHCADVVSAVHPEGAQTTGRQIDIICRRTIAEQITLFTQSVLSVFIGTGGAGLLHQNDRQYI